MRILDFKADAYIETLDVEITLQEFFILLKVWQRREANIVLPITYSDK